jgi:(p)ppGpp synthase/HD superfamily hydrolase
MAQQATLEDAIALAVETHRGQVEKAGQPYCLHLLRVMFRLESEQERMAGVLHDLVEDTPYTLDDLRSMGYPDAVIEVLDCVTHRDGESYEEFIERIKPNPLARRVKIADLEDNMDLRRLPELSERDVARMNRYRRAWAELKALER